VSENTTSEWPRTSEGHVLYEYAGVKVPGVKGQGVVLRHSPGREGSAVVVEWDAGSSSTVYGEALVLTDCLECLGSGASPMWLDGGQGVCNYCGGQGDRASYEATAAYYAAQEADLVDRMENELFHDDWADHTFEMAGDR